MAFRDFSTYNNKVETLVLNSIGEKTLAALTDAASAKGYAEKIVSSYRRAYANVQVVVVNAATGQHDDQTSSAREASAYNNVSVGRGNLKSISQDYKELLESLSDTSVNTALEEGADAKGQGFCELFGSMATLSITAKLSLTLSYPRRVWDFVSDLRNGLFENTWSRAVLYLPNRTSKLQNDNLVYWRYNSIGADEVGVVFDQTNAMIYVNGQHGYAAYELSASGINSAPDFSNTSAVTKAVIIDDLLGLEHGTSSISEAWGSPAVEIPALGTGESDEGGDPHRISVGKVVSSLAFSPDLLDEAIAALP